jgi:hypothetical protein
MNVDFQANSLPLLIGSLPLNDHGEAIDLILKYMHEIPNWVQLPVNKQEGMLVQFLSGLPGFSLKNGNAIVDTSASDFGRDLLKFYEDYIAVWEGGAELKDSRFGLNKDSAKGFFVFMERIKNLSTPPLAVKGQITGPFTLGTGLHDQNKQAIFYNEQIRDAVVKLLALKARWQVRQLSKFKVPVLLFLDEPAMTGMGSSEFISISSQEVTRSLEEVIEAVHLEGGLAGVHVCGNTDWSVVL